MRESEAHLPLPETTLRILILPIYRMELFSGLLGQKLLNVFQRNPLCSFGNLFSDIVLYSCCTTDFRIFHQLCADHSYNGTPYLL